MTYRKWEVKCEDGSCRVESAGKWNKIGVWCATFIAAAAITYPYFIKAQMPAPKDIFSHQSHVILDIEGMTCSSCAVHLQNKLIDMNSVHSAMVNYETRKANIAFDSLEITPEMLAEHVNKTGYKATLSKNNKGTIK